MKSSLFILALFLVALGQDGNAKSKVSRSPKSEPPSTVPGSARLKRAIEDILPPNKKQDLTVGILVTSAETGEVFYERNANELMIPASTNKILTAYGALKKLKPTYTFKTHVYASGPVKDGKLSGDLYIKGGGDPSLVSERLWMLVNELIRAGIKVITGDVIVDSTYYDSEKNPESRPKYLKDQAYNAPIGALSFNFNTTTIYVRPAETAGAPPRVYIDPENSYIDLVNQATTGSAGSKNTLVGNRTEYVKGDIGDTVLLRGSIPLDAKEQHFYRNIVNPALYAGHMFKAFMEQRGLKFQGKVLEGEVSKNARLVLEFESLPLWQIVWGMNKFSNNFVADQLMKKMGAEVWGPPGTLQKGITALQDALEDIGLKKDSYTILDGSGLTRGTKISPRLINRVLLTAYKDFSISSEFISSLGIAGEDGTLKRRFPSSNVQSSLRAKTGTLDGVTALAGYVPSEDKELLSFVIILNDPKNKYGSMSRWADQVAMAISRFSRNP